MPPLNPISKKRLAELAAAGLPRPFSTLNAVSARKRATAGNDLPQVLRRPVARKTGPDDATVEMVWKRDESRCGWCGRPVDPYGTRGVDWSIQHRRPRRQGGDPRPETNGAANLVLAHGSGTTSCHGEMEGKRRGEALAKGFLLHADDIPAEHAIEHAVLGWVYLADDGAWSHEPPERAA